MDGFALFDIDCHEINAAGLRIVRTANAGIRVVPGATAKPPAYVGFTYPRGWHGWITAGEIKGA